MIRARVPTLKVDRVLSPDIEMVSELVRAGALVRAAETVIGAQPWQVP